MSNPFDDEIIKDLLEFSPQAVGGRKVTLSNPPMTDSGEFICGRIRIVNGGECTERVKIPWVPCGQHDPLDPILNPPN